MRSPDELNLRRSNCRSCRQALGENLEPFVHPVSCGIFRDTSYVLLSDPEVCCCPTEKEPIALRLVGQFGRMQRATMVRDRGRARVVL